jgi:hypothetical protein
MAQREIRVTSINVAGVLLMHGCVPLRTMRHERTGVAVVCFAGNATNQDVLNLYNAARDQASEIIEAAEREPHVSPDQPRQ